AADIMQDAQQYDHAVIIPALDIISPMTTTGNNNGWLDLPDPPYSTLYDQSAPIGSEEGASVIASHVDYGQGKDATFSSLHKIEKGTPDIVRDHDEYAIYTADAIELFTREGLLDNIFRQDGDATGYFITCSSPVIDDGSERPYFENNLVVTGAFEG